jgi:hypothetical protein
MLDVIVIAACAALFSVAVVIVARWDRTKASTTYRPRGRAPLAALGAGAVAGVLVAGAGGRLAMGLLALTSPGSRGALTEAQARVGEITAGGTLGFIAFAGVPAGLLTGAVYIVAGRFLPPRRLGGALLGLLLLVLAGATLEPLRSDNIDFNLVGPGWLAVSLFAGLAVLQGMLVVMLSRRWASQPQAHPRRAQTIGLAALAAVTLVALPGFASALADIPRA